jgi:hypothetical protein
VETRATCVCCEVGPTGFDQKFWALSIPGYLHERIQMGIAWCDAAIGPFVQTNGPAAPAHSENKNKNY